GDEAGSAGDEYGLPTQRRGAHLRVDRDLFAPEQVVDGHFAQVRGRGFVADEVAEAGDGAHWQSGGLDDADDLSDHGAGGGRDRPRDEIDTAPAADRRNVTAGGQ